MRLRLILYVLLFVNLFAGCQSAEKAEPVPTATSTRSAIDASAATPVPTSAPIHTPLPIPIADVDGWELIWHDEFDGEALNRSDWTFDLGGGGWGNGEAQLYTDHPENVRLENGLLVIEARKEQNENGGFSSLPD